VLANGLTVAPMDQRQVDALFRDLTSRVRQLERAVSTDLQYDLAGRARVNCGARACTVTANVRGRVTTTDPAARILRGQARGELDATIEVDGAPVGRCTGRGPLPIRGNGRLTCSSRSAGTAYQRVRRMKQAQARAISRASGGRPIRWSLTIGGRAEVQALAQVQVSVLLDRLRLESDLARRPAPRPSPSTAARPSAGTRPTPGATRPPMPSPSATLPPAPAPSPTRVGGCPPQPGGAVRSGGGWIRNTTGSNGRSGRADACFAAPVDKRATRPATYPVGWADAVRRAVAWGFKPSRDLARCHLIPAQLGGSNTLASNFSPCFQDEVNVGGPGMRPFEDRVAGLLAAHPDWTVTYVASPDYQSGSSTVPSAFTLQYVARNAAGDLVDVDYAQIANHRYRDGALRNLGN
jgi:hypothetical protein